MADGSTDADCFGFDLDATIARLCGALVVALDARDQPGTVSRNSELEPMSLALEGISSRDLRLRATRLGNAILSLLEVKWRTITVPQRDAALRALEPIHREIANEVERLTKAYVRIVERAHDTALEGLPAETKERLRVQAHQAEEHYAAIRAQETSREKPLPHCAYGPFDHRGCVAPFRLLRGLKMTIEGLQHLFTERTRFVREIDDPGRNRKGKHDDTLHATIAELRGPPFLFDDSTYEPIPFREIARLIFDRDDRSHERRVTTNCYEFLERHPTYFDNRNDVNTSRCDASPEELGVTAPENDADQLRLKATGMNVTWRTATPTYHWPMSVHLPEASPGVFARLLPVPLLGWVPLSWCHLAGRSTQEVAR